LALEPTNAMAWFNKGITLTGLGQHSDAIDCYDRALGIDPKFAGALYSKAIDLDALGQFRNAIDCFQQFCDLPGGQPAEAASHARQRVRELQRQVTEEANTGGALAQTDSANACAQSASRREASADERRFAALESLADHFHPAPSFYFRPNMFVYVEQITRYLRDQLEQLPCRACGKSGANWIVVEGKKRCTYREGWEKDVEAALSKVPEEVRNNPEFRKTIKRQCRDQFQVVQALELTCECAECGRQKFWHLDNSVIDFVARRYPFPM